MRVWVRATTAALVLLGCGSPLSFIDRARASEVDSLASQIDSLAGASSSLPDTVAAVPDTTESVPDSLSRPKPRRGAWITEAGFGYAVARSLEPYPELQGSFDFGYVARVGERNFLGGDLAFGFHDDGNYFALRPRFRHSLNRNWNMDVALGPVIAGEAQDNSITSGFSALAELNYRGYLGLALVIQSAEYDGQGTQYTRGTNSDGSYVTGPTYEGSVSTTHISARVGRTPGVFVVLGLGIIVLAALAAWSANY